ncbi:hypothetical protein PVK06_040746 [Gossypium arboreum]|uniref:Reverse transcriptase zinc-binding domain-containing protein n=1 Tax=Gossypium arboreum TaxID=29729 RepID=A0ABR0N961_GOSAR|nr:hypothetical protein PVK06_040746 [Gossypium arboreum]
MAAVCKCKIRELLFNYLGIPLGDDLRKISSGNGIKERVERKLSDWKCSSLSWAARIVLINVMLSSLPIYFMLLKVEFPGLFHLAMNKKGLVKDFSISNRLNEDNWADFFIRPLLDKKLNMVVHLKEAVSKVVADISFAYDKIWKLKVPPRVRSFLWLSRLGNVSFSKEDKHGNKMAFALAVEGLKRPGMFKAR